MLLPTAHNMVVMQTKIVQLLKDSKNDVQMAQVIIKFLTYYISSDSDSRHNYIRVNVKLGVTLGPTPCTHGT